MSTKHTRLNREIKAPIVRLIDQDGNQVGEVSIESALRDAQAADLDLVEISPNAEPPVCRIMDYGKYVFQQNKRSKAKQHVIHVKEVKFRPTIEEGDYQVKLRNLIRFLNHGDKVKVTLRFRGRELSHQELGMRLLTRLKADVVEMAVVEFEPKLEGRQLVMVLAPKKSASKTT